jgi:hypothetical protein
LFHLKYVQNLKLFQKNYNHEKNEKTEKEKEKQNKKRKKKAPLAIGPARSEYSLERGYASGRFPTLKALNRNCRTIVERK